MLIFSQGDYAVLNFTATDGDGNPIDLTGATFSTQILGPNPNSGGPVVFSNSQHAIVSAAQGTYTLTLSASDTASCGIGKNKDVVTKITQGGLPISFWGRGILTVNPSVPLQ